MADHPYIMPIFSKTLIKINSFDSYPYSCRYSSFKCIKVGLLTHPVCRAFPAFASGKECNKPKLLHWIGVGIHSNRYCSGFAPDSLFTLQPAMWLLGSLCIAKVCNSFNFRKCFCWIFNSFTSLYLRYNFFASMSFNESMSNEKSTWKVYLPL